MKTLRIQRIEATGIKGQEIDFCPAPVTLISGPNYSGKTAYKLALEWAWLGYVPSLGKTNQAIFELCDGERMCVHVKTEDGDAANRCLTRSGKSIKKDEQVYLEVPPVMCDLGTLFDLPQKDRLAYLFRLAQAGESLTIEKITATIKSVAVKEPSEATEKAILRAVEAVQDAKGETVQEQLEASLKDLDGALRNVKAELRDSEGYARTQTRQADLDAPVTNAKAKITACREELSRLHDEQVAATNAVRNASKKQSDLSAAEQALSEAEELAPVAGVEVSPNNERLEELEAIIAKKEEFIASTREILETFDVEFAQERLGECKANGAKLAAEIEALQNDYNAILRAVAKAEFQLESVREMECCPTCGADGVTWREKMLSGIHDNLAAMEADGKQCDDGIIAKKRLFKKTSAERQTAQITVNTCSEQQKELNIGQADLDKARRTLDAERRQHETAVERLRQVAAQRAERSSQLVATHFNLFIEVKALPALGDLELKSAEATGAESEARFALVEADKQLNLEIANRSKELELQKAIVRRQQLEADKEVFAAAGKALQELQREAIKDSFAPLLSVARRFTDGILKAPLDFHEGELGYWENSRFVNHETFSGCEESLAYTGLMVALSNASDSPLKIAMIDEMGRFDRQTTRPAVIERMRELTGEGVIGNFIGIDPDMEFCQRYEGADGVLVHWVGGAT